MTLGSRLVTWDIIKEVHEPWWPVTRCSCRNCDQKMSQSREKIIVEPQRARQSLWSLKGVTRMDGRRKFNIEHITCDLWRILTVLLAKFDTRFYMCEKNMLYMYIKRHVCHEVHEPRWPVTNHLKFVHRGVRDPWREPKVMTVQYYNIAKDRCYHITLQQQHIILITLSME